VAVLGGASTGRGGGGGVRCLLWIGEEVFLMVHMALRPVHTSDGMHEHNEGFERTCAAKSPEHVFRQVVGVDRTVVFL